VAVGEVATLGSWRPERGVAGPKSDGGRSIGLREDWSRYFALSMILDLILSRVSDFKSASWREDVPVFLITLHSWRLASNRRQKAEAETCFFDWSLPSCALMIRTCDGLGLAGLVQREVDDGSAGSLEACLLLGCWSELGKKFVSSVLELVVLWWWRSRELKILRILFS